MTEPKTTSSALIGNRRVQIAICDDDIAAAERWLYHGINVIRSIRRVEQGFGAR